MNQLTVLFKKSDFKQSDFFNIFDCPTNRALQRCFPDAKIQVGGRTLRIDNKKYSIGEFRMNGSLMSSRGLSTPVLAHVHQAIWRKRFSNAGLTITEIS